MKIIDINGEEISREDCDFDRGRLLQSEDDSETYIYSPWDKVPCKEEESEPEDDFIQARFKQIDDAVAEMGEMIAGIGV